MEMHGLELARSTGQVITREDDDSGSIHLEILGVWEGFMMHVSFIGSPSILGSSDTILVGYIALLLFTPTIWGNDIDLAALHSFLYFSSLALKAQKSYIELLSNHRHWKMPKNRLDACIELPF